MRNRKDLLKTQNIFHAKAFYNESAIVSARVREREREIAREPDSKALGQKCTKASLWLGLHSTHGAYELLTRVTDESVISNEKQ